ncbi:MAG: tRNA uridine-5-carboxymethylaminomethyl(34) synthesis GTPase MnmE [Clostridiales bacterium]|nr:tRNA uridine-5-carboxymethylaminomethyl(34) synthesis GTPase MnmE [Clostridiales bacterium]
MSTGTIAAISTPQSAGGIGIIRISGENALSVADSIFMPVGEKKPGEVPGYHALYGKVYDEGQPIDEAVCLVFRAPHSYTGENVAEISCHGGLYITKRVLQAALKAGAVPAQPGEFTKRAFLNGKIDLSEAEAVMSLISAKGEQAANAALNALDGALSREISQAAQVLVGHCAHIAAWVDYPDEEIEDIELQNLLQDMKAVREKLRFLLDRFDSGRAVTEGVDTVIVGRPNVGKSTLMNLLSGSERSIVTGYEGTTRDIVEETVRLGNVVLRLADTAGIRDTENPVESIGVELAKKRLDRAELALIVLDSSRPLTDGDKALFDACEGKRSIAIINKTDLPCATDREYIRGRAERCVELSAIDPNSAESLSRCVEELLGTADFDSSAAMLANERQRACCAKAVQTLTEGIDALESGMTLDAVNVCMDSAIDALLELTGQRAGEAVVDEVFSRFCVGK